MDYSFRPIDQWPGKRSQQRRRSHFKASYSDTLRLLQYELGRLGATNVVIQADCDETQIRRDGMLRSDAKLRGPGVIVAFDSKHGPMQYPCDTYANWDCNLRAIALSLKALRDVDRYGVSKHAEQYKGWAKLPGPVAEAPVTTEKAAGILLQFARGTFPNLTAISRQILEEVYRAAVANAHPDRGGNAEDFKRVQEAKEVLDKHFGTAA